MFSIFVPGHDGASAARTQCHVLSSDDSGIVSEVVHLVVSYTTEDDLNRFANEVIEFLF